MTKADLIDEVSRVVEMPRKDSEVIVDAIFASTARSLGGGDKGRDSRFWQFSDTSAAGARGPESEDGNAYGNTPKEGQ